MTFGERVKNRRIELNMSAGELGSLIGKNRATIYRYEKGDIENVPLDVLEPLADALDVTPEYLLGWSSSRHLGTRIKQGENETTYIGMTEANVRNFEKWHEEFGLETFTDEEHDQLIELGKYLIWKRTHKEI